MIPASPASIPVPVGRTSASEVAEFQGLYGAYHVSELLLQKIWLRGGFDQARARTIAGEPVSVLHPGSWNRLSGPDFRGSRLRIGGREVRGDVEVHFHAAAWHQHGHQHDPAYGDVILHVVLYPPDPAAPAVRRADGGEIPTLVLVDLLWHDLEEYAADEAVAALSSRDAMPLVEHLLALEPTQRSATIHAAAAQRWRDKLRYARLRIDRCGWDEACHLTALEILGYRANREGMLRVGTCFPWKSWASAGQAPGIDALLAAGADAWTRRGVRPANQPALRLAQYARWMERTPDWPQRLRAWVPPAIEEPGEAPIVRQRKLAGLARLRESLAQDLTGAQLGGLRLDTFIVNLVLPFCAAGATSEPVSAARWWRLWTPGDLAEVLLEAARRLASPGTRDVRTNETAQGLLGLHLQRALALPTPP